MALHDLPGAQFKPPNPDEYLRKANEFRGQFPIGLAPFTRRNLLAYAFLGGLVVLTQPLAGTYGLPNVLFPTGIVAAGIAGAVSLRRADQPRAVLRLLLLTVALAFICALGASVILQAKETSDPLLRARNNIIMLLVYLVLGMLYAIWIAHHQRPLRRRWQELNESPVRKNQGGFLTAFGWLVVMNFVNVLLIFFFYQSIVPRLSPLIYPPPSFSEHGNSVTLPAGWVQIDSANIGENCSSTLYTCLVIARDTATTSIAEIFIGSAQGMSLASRARATVAKIRAQFLGELPTTPQPYTLPSLHDHGAYTLTLDAVPYSYRFTLIAAGDYVIEFNLVCPFILQSQCDSVRDQIVSTMQFASAS